VLDTNVVISAILWDGKPGELLALAGEGEVRLHTSRQLLDELRTTLERPKLAPMVELTGQSVAELLADYRRLATLTRRASIGGRWSRDPDDDHVIAAALAARADLLITGDVDLLELGAVEGMPILTPAAALLALT
jgi:putative PIN family toxin of toxin-antitoxin system